MKRAIVIGCHVNGLGVIRSLGMEGFEIIALSYNMGDFAQASKYVREKAKTPHPGNEEKGFIEFLTQNSCKWKDALLLETNDESLIAVSKNKEQLARHYKIATADWHILRRFIEKPETYKIAEKCEVPYPKTFLPKTLNEIHQMKDELTYPCIIKPVFSHEFIVRFGSKNFVVNNHEELSSKFEICHESGHEVMVQEIIPGPDSRIFQCIVHIGSNGKFNAAFFLRKMRQNPPRFGVARVAVSHDEIAQIRQFTESMLRDSGFTGIAHSEFKKDPRDNRFKLMEINGRSPRANWLATYCGVNFPLIAYLDLVEKKQIEITAYRKNTYWIELYQDMANSVLRRNMENLGFSDYVRPYLSKSKTFADLSMEDPMPFLKRLSHWPMRHYRYSNWRNNKQ